MTDPKPNAKAQAEPEAEAEPEVAQEDVLPRGTVDRDGNWRPG